MAKETKAEQIARIAVDRDNEWNVFVDTYSTRLLALMYAYLANVHAGFFVIKLDENTYEFGRNDYHFNSRFCVNPPVNYDLEYISNMDDCEGALISYEKEIVETSRKRKVKEAALAKLNTEERELLGL